MSKTSAIFNYYIAISFYPNYYFFFQHSKIVVILNFVKMITSIERRKEKSRERRREWNVDRFLLNDRHVFEQTGIAEFDELRVALSYAAMMPMGAPAAGAVSPNVWSKDKKNEDFAKGVCQSLWMSGIFRFVKEHKFILPCIGGDLEIPVLCREESKMRLSKSGYG